MKTITVNLYEYDELNKEAQAKAVDTLREINVDHDWWEIDGWNALEALSAAGIETDMRGISFDLGRASYAYFTPFNIRREGKTIGEHQGIWIESTEDHVRLAKALVKEGALPKSYIKLAKDEDIYFKVERRHYGGGDGRNLLNVYANTDKGYEALDNMTAEQADAVQAWIDNHLDALRKELRDEYEYLTSDEAVIETIRMNEYDFTEDGKLA